MVLNMADFGKSWKSLQTLWKGSKALINWFLTALATLCVYFRWIRKSRKLADFEQKPWAIDHGFEHGRFWQVLEIAPNSLKRFQSPRKLIFNCFGDTLCRFRVNSEESKFGRFWAKTLGYTPWFWTGSILASTGNRSKLSETVPTPSKRFFTALATICVHFRTIRKGRKLADFSKNPGL